MSEVAERYRRIAGRFTERAESVPGNAWDNPSPCDGWAARDIVGHMVDWMPALFLDSWGIEHAPFPSVDDDPVGAWRALTDSIQSTLDDPVASQREADIRPGRFSFEQAVDMFGTGDIVIHTWDLARATGLDETLDPADVQRLLEGMEPMDEALRQSGHYGPRVEVPDDADVQTKLIAFTGRHP